MKLMSYSNKIKFHFSKLRHPFTGERYEIGVGGSDKCQITCCATVFCVFEDITVESGKVYVGHFSVEASFRGGSIGEQCLRKFAAHIARLDSTITSIEFSLYKLPTNFPHQRIAQARFDLLNRIGATATTMNQLPQGNFLVRGSWDKSKW